MAEAFNFELVSPERLLVSEPVTEVVIPAADGYMTILAKHAPLMSTVKPGVVSVKRADGKQDRYVVFGGFADVSAEGLTLLAESAVHADDINREDLQKRIQEAKEDLADAKTHEHRIKAEEFLGQLTTLEAAILPA